MNITSIIAGRPLAAMPDKSVFKHNNYGSCIHGDGLPLWTAHWSSSATVIYFTFNSSSKSRQFKEMLLQLSFLMLRHERPLKHCKPTHDNIWISNLFRSRVADIFKVIFRNEEYNFFLHFHSSVICQHITSVCWWQGWSWLAYSRYCGCISVTLGISKRR